MRTRFGRAVSALGVGALLALVPIAAQAAEPPTLGDSNVYDGSDVLSDADERAAADRLDELRDSSDVELWVVYVDEFTAPADSGQWADAAAQLNGLGSDQYLLAIATEARQLYLSAPLQASLDESDYLAIEEAAGDALSGDDWAGAVDAAADALQKRSAPNYTIWWVLGGLVVVIAIVVVVLTLVRAAKKRRAEHEARQRLAAEVDEIRTKASGLLVEMDDSLRTAEQEMGFAIAQFGADAVAEYDAALTSARASLNRSFGIQQALEDTEPETLEEQRERYGEIVTLLEQADADLDEKAEDFEQLRAIEQNAPEVLERLAAARAAAADGPERIAAEIARLRETYASTAIDDVEDNADEVTTRLEFADLRLAEARQRIQAGDSGDAALDLHEAEQALGQVDELVDAVTSLQKTFAEAEKDAREAIADLENDIRTAQALPDADGVLARAVATTRQHIQTARENLSGGERAPLKMFDALEQADDQMDQALASARAEQERLERQRAHIDRAIRQAQAQLRSARSLVGTRRGAIGSNARAQIARAEGSIDEARALRDTDPARALSAAKGARTYAGRASSQARSDVRRYASRGHSGGSFGAQVAGGIIGGLVGAALSGGSRRGSGWGRSSRRGLGGLSFGGGGRRGGGGLSFGGGRGRSGGGRRF